MKIRVTNNGKAPYGIEQVGGGYMFVQPGATRTPDAVNPGPLYDKAFLDVEAADSEVTAPPASIGATAAKIGRDPLDHDGNGRKGGSRKGSPRRKAARK